MFTRARWITDPAFAGLAPRQVLRLARAPDRAGPHRDDLANRHGLFRTTFRLDRAPGSARLRLTADDWYRLRINGRLVGEGPAPGYPYRYFVNEWDVAPFLVAGENVIAVHVYYQGLVNRVWNSGDHRQGLIAELEADGAIVAASDGAWRHRVAEAWSSLGTVGYATQFLERFDSAQVVLGWDGPGFDDASWARAVEKTDHDYAFTVQPTPVLARYPVAPVRIERRGTVIFADFGRETVGNLVLRARGRAGDVIELRCGEELNADGTVRFAMRCNCTYREEWLLSGRADDELEQVDYKAFRYLEVTVPEGVEVDAGSIRAIARNYPLDDRAWSWSSSLPELDAIVGLCVHTLRVGAQDGILDCPTREKGQYLGDLTISGQAHRYVSGDLRYARKCIEDFAASTRFAPGMMAAAPGAFMQEIADFSLQWPGQVLRHWRHSGDREFASAMLPVAERVLHDFARYRRADGLIADVTDKWNLVDWPDGMRDGYDFPLPDPTGPGMHAVINAHYVDALRSTAALAADLGIATSADPEPVADAFRTAFYRPQQRLFADTATSSHCSLHVNALALYAGLAPAEAVPSIVAHLRDKGMVCGVYMSYFLLKALFRAGAADAAWELLLSDGPNSWRNMLREGATTTFEAWGKERKWNTSLCHPWATAPIPLLVEDVVGLSPAEPGWRKIRFAPRVPAGLGTFRLRLTTACGVVEVEHGPRGTDLRVPDGVLVERG